MPIAAAAILLSACDPSLGPEPRHAPEPVVAEATVSRTGVDYDGLLQAMSAGQPVNAEQRRIIHMLAETLARTSNPGAGEAMNPSLSPAAERALREFAASPGGEAAMRRVLERLAAEPARHDPQ